MDEVPPELLIEKPSRQNRFMWTWTVFDPVSGGDISYGQSLNYIEASQQAERALSHAKKQYN